MDVCVVLLMVVCASVCLCLWLCCLCVCRNHIVVVCAQRNVVCVSA